MKKLLFLLLLMVPFFSMSAHAESYPEDIGAEWNVNAVRDALPEDIREIGGELSFSGEYDGAGALERLWLRFLQSLTDRLRENAREAFSVLAITMLCAVCGTLAPEQDQTAYVQIAGCCAVSYLLAGGVNSLVNESLLAIRELSDYGKAVLPAVYSAAAAGGAPSSASARYAASCLALDVMMSAAERLILPLFCAYIAMAVCGGIFDNALLRTGIRLSKKLAALLMSGLTIVFTAFLSVTGVVTGSADAAAIKTAKTLISTALPVVGGMMSDAAASVLGAASVIRSAAGAFGMVAVVAVCLSPFASLAVKKLLFTLASAAAEMTAGDRLARLLGDLSAGMSLLLGLVGSFGLMLFFCIASAVRTVTG